MKAFEEYDLAGCKLKNRFVMAPMISNLADADGSTNPVHTAYLNERAMGGFSLIITEYSFVPSPVSRGSRNQLSFARYDQIGKFRRLSERIHGNGSKIFAQLVHAGGKALTLPGEKAIAPSAVPYNGRVPRQLDEKDMEEIRDAFVKSAKIVEMSEFDGIELHGAHGYLLQEFMSPALNRREDKYGGSIENMLRFPQEVIDAIREEVSIPVGIRLSLYEDDPDGYPPEHGMKIVEHLKNIDYVHFSSGRFEPPGSSASYYSEHNHIISKIPRKPGLTTIGVGSITSAEDVENALKHVDLVALGRAALADPFFPENIKRNRKVRPCIRCNQACRNLAFGEVRCTVNPMTGNETLKTHARLTGRVKIAGAGISGLEAAIFLAQKGMDVTIIEKSNRIGGQINEIREERKRNEFLTLIEYYESRIRELGITLILNKKADMRFIDLFMGTGKEYPDIVREDEIYIDSNIYKHLDQALDLAKDSKVFMTERSLDSMDRHRQMEYRKIAESSGIEFVKERDGRFKTSWYERNQYDIYQASKRGLWAAMKYVRENY